jgi:hypothetical protein
MISLDALKHIRYVLDARGRQSAVQVSMKDWISLMEYLEDLEDRETVKEKLAVLRKGPGKSGALSWRDIQGQW